MTKHHNLKIESRYLDRVMSGQKTFEIRKNDRDFQVGDFVCLVEISGSLGGGRLWNGEITYITDYEQQPGYVVFGIKERNDND